jgi:hypothetical protein
MDQSSNKDILSEEVKSWEDFESDDIIAIAKE